MRLCSRQLVDWMGALAVATLPLAAPVARAGENPGAPPGLARIRILWSSVDLQPQCHVNVGTVEDEVRRIFRGMDIEVDWSISRGATSVSPGDLSIVALLRDPGRPEIMGATHRGSLTAWVYCSSTALALGVDAKKPLSALPLGRALGRVVAHEVVHMLAPAEPHRFEGLMVARWRQELTEPWLSADVLTRRAVRERFLLAEPASDLVESSSDPESTTRLVVLESPQSAGPTTFLSAWRRRRGVHRSWRRSRG